MRKLGGIVVALVVVIVSGLVVLGPPGNGHGSTLQMASGSDQVSCGPDTVLENLEVRLWFQGLKGQVQVFDTQGYGITQAYTYHAEGVAETLANDTVARLDLGHAWPHDSTCSIEASDDHVNITYVVSADVRGPTGEEVGEATVSFVFHDDKRDAGARFDLFVDDWPWQSNASTLAFDFGIASADASETAENGRGLRDGSDPRGYITWAPNATVTYGDGHEERALVDSTTYVYGDHNATVRLAFTNVTAGYVHLDLLGGLLPLGLLDPFVPAELRPATDLVERLV